MQFYFFFFEKVYIKGVSCIGSFVEGKSLCWLPALFPHETFVKTAPNTIRWQIFSLGSAADVKILPEN